MLEKLFKLSENKTDVKTEVLAGVTTFMTMAYILAVNPRILSQQEWIQEQSLHTVTDDNIFCQEGKLQEAGIIEHIAQSAAARIGYIYLQKNEPVPLGFIGSVDKLTLHRLPETGQKLSTEITVIQEVFDITLVSACVSTTEGVIAECRMKIFLDKK